MTEPDNFQWDKSKERAAQLLADGKLSDREIAQKIEVSERQLNRWKLVPEFQARRKEYLDAWTARVRDRFLAIKEGRVDKLMEADAAIDRILKERGEQLGGELSNSEGQTYTIAGGSTGYIAKDFKGKEANVPVYLFDAALMREKRALYDQIAEELGQQVKRHEHTGGDDKSQPIRVEVVYAIEPAKS